MAPSLAPQDGGARRPARPPRPVALAQGGAAGDAGLHQEAQRDVAGALQLQWEEIWRSVCWKHVIVIVKHKTWYFFTKTTSTQIFQTVCLTVWLKKCKKTNQNLVGQRKTVQWTTLYPWFMWAKCYCSEKHFVAFTPTFSFIGMENDGNFFVPFHLWEKDAEQCATYRYANQSHEHVVATCWTNRISKVIKNIRFPLFWSDSWD